MATDQPPDATAARLLERVMEAAELFHYDNIEGEENPEQARRECLADERCSYLREQHTAALDTLIRYHRSVAARDALLEFSRSMDSECFCLPAFESRDHQEYVCSLHTLLAAANERVAAFDEAHQ